MFRSLTLSIAIALTAISAAVPVTAAHHISAVTTRPAAAARMLLETDQAFAKKSAGQPGFQALSGMFANDVVIFAQPVPGFASGRAAAIDTLTKAVGSSSAKISWTPIRVGISADGLQGFTLGFLDSSAEGQPPKHAKYLSYWTKDSSGWHVRLFKRKPRPDGAVSTQLLPPSLPRRIVGGKADPALLKSYREALAGSEKAFSDEAQRIGLGPAFLKFGSPRAVNLGGDTGFLVGPAAIAEAEGPESTLHWAADQGVLVASSGDLGVTWGYLRRNGPTPPGRLPQIPFFTVWYRSSPTAPWLYIAE